MSTQNMPDPNSSPLPPPLPRRRRRWLSVLLAMVVFVSGLVIGGGGALFIVKSEVLKAIHHPEQTASQLAARLSRKFGLTADQTQQVKQILEDRQAGLRAIWNEVQPRVEKQLDLLEQQVAEVLNDRQKEQWHKACDQQRRTWIPPLPAAEASASPKGGQP